MKRTPGLTYRSSLGALALLLLFTAPAAANRLIPFQGRVTDGGGQPLQGVYRVTFTIYDEPTGGVPLYAESHADVSIIGGQVNVLLGSLVSLDDPNGDQNDVDAVLFDETLKPRFLGIKVGAETNQEMVPRHQLVPSFHARIADTTVDGGVDTAQLANGAVTVDKIDPTAIIPAGSILPYGGAMAPPGWVLCDGTTYDGTLPEFTPLFNAIGLNFGGSGNMFKVPDLRGQFLRGRDAGRGADPDAAARTGGDAVGSTQGSATIPLAGSTSFDGSHQHALPYYRVATFLGAGSLTLGFISIGEENGNANTYSGGSHNHGFNAAPPAALSSTEVRPTNVAVNYICKL